MNLPITYKVDISKPLLPTPLQPMLISGDAEANVIRLELYDGETPYSPGGSCVGMAVRQDGGTVPITGTVNGNVMTAALPAAAYAIPGAMNLIIKNVNGDVKTSLFFGCGNVLIGETGTAIDPGTIIPSVADLIQDIADAVATIPPDYSTLSGAVHHTAGAVLPTWESGGLYSATGIEYIPTGGKPIRTTFIPVTPGETYRFDWTVQHPINIYAFASNAETSAGVNERTNYKAARYADQPLYYTVPAGVHYIRIQQDGATIADDKPTMINFAESILHAYTMEQTAAQTRQIIGTDAIATKTAAAAIIPEGADLDDYTAPGNYYPATTAIAGSLSNLPYSPFVVKFRLMVLELAGTGNPVQLMITEAAVPRIFKRYCAGGTWRAWTEVATMDSVIAATAEIIDADITGSNKADYFADADDAPVNTVYSVSSTAEMANTPLGPGVASNGETSYTDLRSIAGYQSGVLYTYKSGVMINQLFVSTTKGSNNASGDPTVLWYRSKWQYGSWSDWHATGDRVALSASNIIIVNKMIAPYMDANGNYTAVNTGIDNPQYMGDDPRIFNDFNNAPINKMYQIDLNCTSELMANNPMPGKSSVLCTFGFGYASTHGRFQLCVGLNYPNPFAFIRYGYFQSTDAGFVWTPWASLTAAAQAETFGIKARLDNGTDLDTVKASGVYLLGTNGGYINAPTGLTYGFLTVKTINVITCQTVETPGGNFARFYDGSAWGAWR